MTVAGELRRRTEGIQPGAWALTIDLEKGRAKVPFTIEALPNS